MGASKQLTGAGVEAALAAQGIELAPGRAERLARTLEASIGPSARDPLREALELEAEPFEFADVLSRNKAR
jgi:hypothetical protein